VFIARWPRRRIILLAASVLAVLVAVATVAALRGRGAPGPQQVAFSDLLQDLERGGVAEVVVIGDALSVKRTDGTTVRTMAPPNYVSANPSFVSDLAKRGVRVEVATRPSSRRTATSRSRSGLVSLRCSASRCIE